MSLSHTTCEGGKVGRWRNNIFIENSLPPKIFPVRFLPRRAEARKEGG